MKRYFAILFLALLLSFSASAQFFQNTVVKIRPNKALFTLHPNLGFEKPIHRNFSITAEIAYKFICVYSNRFEAEFDFFSGCTGGELFIGARGYWGKVNKHLTEYDQKAPFGWYGEIQLGYRGININSYHASDPSVNYVEDVAINDLMSVYLLGYQFNAGNRITFDLNIGFNFHWLKSWRHDIISVEEIYPESNNKVNIQPGDTYRETEQRFGFACSFALGYYIRFKKQQ